DHVVTELIVLDGSGKVQELVGGYTDYLKLKQQQKKSAAKALPPSPVEPLAKGKTAKARKFLNRERWEWESLPTEIEKLEKEQHELAEKLGSPEIYQDAKKLTATQKRLDALEAELLQK